MEMIQIRTEIRGMWFPENKIEKCIKIHSRSSRGMINVTGTYNFLIFQKY